MKPRSVLTRSLLAMLVATCVGATLMPVPTLAAVPQTLLLEGVLTGASGGAAPDGDYGMTVRIRSSDSNKLLHEEGPIQVKVTGGRFAWTIGGDGKLGAAAEAAEFWAEKGLRASIQIGSEPELGPFDLHSSISALRARMAEGLQCTGCVSANHLAVPFAGAKTKGGPAADLDCTGCVSVAELKFDGDVDLGGNSLKAGNGSFSGDLVAKTVTAQSFVGDGSKLTGIVIPSGSCPKGQVVSGIASDGKLVCAAGGGTLPADGLDEVSGGVLSTEFDDVFKAPTAGVTIPDNTGADAVSTITVPDIGVAKGLLIHVELANSDLSQVSMTLLPPDDKAKGITLCDPCGKADEKSLKTAYPTPTAVVSGDLSSYLGKSPKGTWTLKVKDTSFCVPQKPGNQALCDLQAKTDGSIVNWDVTVHTLSTSKAQVLGDLVVSGGISSQNGLLVGGTSATCGAGLFGRLRMNDPGGLEMCNGTEWVAALPRPVYWQGGCTSNGSTSWAYFCTNHTDSNTAGRYLGVSSVNSGNSSDPGTGKITIKIAGTYRVAFDGWGSAAQRYWELYVNGKLAAEGRNYNAGSSNNSLHFERLLVLDVGDTLNLRLYADSGTSWYGAVADTGKAKLAKSSWLRVEYAGHNWKAKPVCGDGELDPGEQCDDGNSKDDDACSNACKVNVPAQQAWSEVVTSSQSPVVTLGTIPGIPGKSIVIYKIGLCGDSDQTSGPNVFQLSGGGLSFTWESGQSSQSSTYVLSPTPVKGASRGLTTKEVSYTATAGASLTIQWTYHADWDGLRCTDTDEFGNVYDDQTGSSLRAWISYGYK